MNFLLFRKQKSKTLRAWKALKIVSHVSLAIFGLKLMRFKNMLFTLVELKRTANNFHIDHILLFQLKRPFSYWFRFCLKLKSNMAASQLATHSHTSSWHKSSCDEISKQMLLHKKLWIYLPINEIHFRSPSVCLIDQI